jgi:hypothetical protein
MPVGRLHSRALMIAAVLMREGRLTLQSAQRSSDALGPEEGVAQKGTRPPRG